MISLALACCSGDTPAPGTVGAVRGFLGAAVADEPQAALIGRDVLSAGGSAADAATAMYFTMAVTLPSAASLGGGGVCVTFNRDRNEIETLDFLARAPSQGVRAGADRPTAVPGNVRGFFALHARYGRLRWSQVLSPAENLARFGISVSRAFAEDVREVESALLVEPQVRRIFSADGGSRLVREGDALVQLDLATVLARIRTQGAGDFYAGALGTQLQSAVAEAGGTLDRDDLAAYQPLWRKPLTVGFDSYRAHFPPPPPDGGAIAGQMWAMLTKDGRYAGADAPARTAMVADAGERAFADRPRWSGGADVQGIVSSATVDALLGERLAAGDTPGRPAPTAAPAIENPSAASLLAIDRDGSAVACSVTLNSLFGTGRVAAGTGVVLASLPGQAGRGAAMLGPMLVVQPRGRQFVFAGAASGGVAAPTSLVEVAARALLADEPIAAAVAAPRVHAGSDPPFIYAEPGANAQALQTLVERQDEVVIIERLGRVLGISCPDGLPDSPDRCQAASDPRGFGLAASTD